MELTWEERFRSTVAEVDNEAGWKKAKSLSDGLGPEELKSLVCCLEGGRLLWRVSVTGKAPVYSRQSA